MSKKQQNKSTGAVGEALAARFFMERGHKIAAMNYRCPLAEIDLITRNGEKVHFVEVKTLSFETKHDLRFSNEWRPEEQVHKRKLQQIKKGVEYWISEHRYTGNVQVDVLAVKIVPRETYSTVNYIENVIVGWDVAG